jgi:hypothetical protein
MQLQVLFVTSLISTGIAAGLERRQDSSPSAACVSGPSTGDESILTSFPSVPSAVASLSVLATTVNPAVITPFCAAGGASALNSFTSAVSNWNSQNSAWLSSQLAGSSLCPSYSAELAGFGPAVTFASTLGGQVSSLCAAVSSLSSLTSAGAAPTNMAGYAGAAIAGALGVVAVL